MAANDIPFRIVAETKDALKSVEKFGASASSSLEGIEKSFAQLKAVALAAVAVVASGKVVDFLKDSARAAAESEKAISGLNVALKLSGSFTASASKAFQDMADQLQRVTVFTDEQVLKSVSLAKSFNISNERAKQLVRAAADLASAFDLDLTTATQLLGRTMDGTAGRLVEMIPQLRMLSKEQLQAGAAVDLVANRFRGAAEAMGSTYSGALIKAANAFDNFQEVIGGFITQNAALRSVLNSIPKFFLALEDVLNRNQTTIDKFITDGIVGILKALPPTMRAILNFAKTLANLWKVLTTVWNVFSGVVGAVNKFNIAMKMATLPLQLLWKAVSRGKDEVKEGMENPLNSAINLMEELATTAEKSAAIQRRASTDASTGLKNQNIVIVEQISLLEQLARGSAVFSKFQENAIGALAGQVDFGKDDKGNQINPTGTQRTVGAIAGLSGQVLGGQAGATKFVSQAGALAANAILPGLGAVAGPLLEEFAKGPEHVKKMVEEFVKALPQIVINIVKAVPAFITALIKSIPTIIREFIKAIPEIVMGFAQAMLEIPGQFLEALLKGLAEGIKGIFDFINGGESGGLFGGGGFLGTGIGNGSKGVFGGGIIPGVDLIPNDFPILGGLFKGGSGGGEGGGTQTLVVHVRVGENELAKTILQLNQQGFRMS